ncbi:Uncharacterised protein [uncultured Clostridium sp.]|nr:Uncharacterised protein [uncultured Clostridium sp.]
MGKSGELVKITAYGVERLIEFIFSLNRPPTMNSSKQQEIRKIGVCILIIVIIGKDRNGNEMLFYMQIVSRNVNRSVI